MSAHLNAADPWDSERDPITDTALTKLAAFVAEMPGGFELKSSQAHMKSVTATLSIDGCDGPMAQNEGLQRLLQGAMFLECVVRNLLHERGQLAAPVGGEPNGPQNAETP